MRPLAAVPATTPSVVSGAAEITIAGAALLIDPSGVLYWPDEGLLVVADLHLEKGSSYARRGVLLPPYDTAATLTRFTQALARFAPRLVVALGDSFHDGDGPARIATIDRAALGALQRGRDWIWLAGNHDPDPANGIGGIFSRTLAIGPLAFCHEPASDAPPGQIAGHLHPVARVSQRGRTISRRCFVSDGRRLVMPAFGAYTGGLNVRHAAFCEIFGSLEFTAHLLGEGRLYGLTGKRCLTN